MREAERAALSAPTIFEGIAQSAERMRHMHQVEGANRSALTICPCGVVQTTCLPLMQEITGAKPVGDANSIALKALSAMRSLGKRTSSVQFRVGVPVFGRVVKREQQTPQIENL